MYKPDIDVCGEQSGCVLQQEHEDERNRSADSMSVTLRGLDRISATTHRDYLAIEVGVANL